MYEIFADLLAKNGKKAADVSRATGIPSSTFSDWKKGKSAPKQDKLEKIAEYFGVSVQYLRTGTEKYEQTLIRPKGDITDELNKLILELEDEEETVFYDGQAIDKRTASIMRNALEIAFDNLEARKKRLTAYNEELSKMKKDK